MKQRDTKRKQKKVRSVSDSTPAYRSVVEGRGETTSPEKTPRRGRSVGKLVLRLLAVMAVIAVLAVAWQYRDRYMPDGFLVWADEMLAGGNRGDGFPVTADGSTAKAMTAIKGNLAYLTDTSLVLLNDSGGVVASRAHNFADPAMKTAGTYALVIERGGKRVRLERRSGTLLTHTHEQSVLTAALAENGTFAVASGESKSYLSQVKVYSKEDKNVYNWYSADQLVADVALSADGNRMAVIGLSAKEGEICSTLFVFDLQKGEDAKPVTYQKTDVMLCSAAFLPNGSIAAVGDNALWIITPDGARVEHTYEGNELMGAAFASDSAAVVLRRYGTTTGGRLLVLDQNGKETQNTAFDSSFRDIGVSGASYLLLTDETVTLYDKNGPQKTAAVTADGQYVAAVGNTVYVMGLTAINQIAWQ